MFEKYRVRLLQKAHRQEIERYLADPDFARKESKSRRHGAIGDWLDPGLGKRVLEVGCGPGKYVAMLGAMGFDVVGFDPLEFPEWQAIRSALPVDLRSGIAAEELPFEDESFDHVCCFGTLLYLNDPVKSLHEMRRVLKPGGRIAIRTVNRLNNYTRLMGKKLDPVSKNLYSMDELEELLRAIPFQVKRSFAFGYWPSKNTNFYWFLQTVVLPYSVIDRLDRVLRSENRHNNIVHAARPS